MGQLSLADRDLYIFNGTYRSPTMATINQVFECRQPVLTLVLTAEEDFEYCDVLELMYGFKPKVMTLWDWHDEFWERLHDRTGQTVETLIQDIATDRHDFIHLAEKAYVIDKIKKDELERRKCRHLPPITFDYKAFRKEFI